MVDVLVEGGELRADAPAADDLQWALYSDSTIGVDVTFADRCTIIARAAFTQPGAALLSALVHSAIEATRTHAAGTEDRRCVAGIAVQSESSMIDPCGHTGLAAPAELMSDSIERHALECRGECLVVDHLGHLGAHRQAAVSTAFMR